MTTIYSYDEDGAFTGSLEARESPREPGVFLIPQGATELEPPQAGPGEAAFFDGESWSIVEDHRSEISYNTTTQKNMKVDYLGAVRDGFTLLEPPDHRCKWTGTEWQLPLNDLVDEKIHEIRMFALSRIKARIPALDEIEMVQLLATLWPVLSNPASQPDLLYVRDIYQYTKKKSRELRAAKRSEIEDYNPESDIGWPT